MKLRLARVMELPAWRVLAGAASALSTAGAMAFPRGAARSTWRWGTGPWGTGRWRRWAPSPPHVLVAVVMLLLTIGTVMVFSASFFHRSVGGDPYFFLRRQALWLPIAVLAGALAARLDHRVLARAHPWILAFTALLLALVFVPQLGLERNGARRWIGVKNIQFQPSELAKLAVLLFVAGFAANGPERTRLFWRGFVPVCGGVFLLAGLVLVEPDFGTALYVLAVGGAAFLLAGFRKRYATLGLLLLSPALAAFMTWRWEQIHPRLLAFVEPEKIYQVKQSLMSFGAGGLWGVGLGAGGMKLKFLPEPQTDFIYAVIGEELGFLGTSAVLLLFVILVYAAAAVAHRARDQFGFLLASGIAVALGLQAAINIAVVTASAPTKGIPLPFITFGGSGLVMAMVQVGLLLSVDRASREARAASVPEAAP